MITDALEFAPQCLAYLDKLQNPQVQRFCAIPQLMAIATQAALYNNPKVFTGIVKIRPGLAAQLMLSATDDPSPDNVRLWFGRFATEIEAKVLQQQQQQQLGDGCETDAMLERTLAALRAIRAA